MKTSIQFAARIAAVFAATAGSAMAAANLIPEPGSLALVGVAVVALIAFSGRGKK